MFRFIRYWKLDFELTILKESKTYIWAGLRRKNDKVDIQSIYVYNETHERHDTLIPQSRFIKDTLTKILLQLREHTVLRCKDGNEMHVQLYKDTNQINYFISTYTKQGYIDIQVLGELSNAKIRKAYKEAITNIVAGLKK